MAFNAGSIFASLNLNTTNFTSQLRSAAAQLKSTGNQMKNAFNNGVQNNINSTANSTQKLTSNFKSLERIVGGILLAQAFYKITNAIEDGAKAVLNFSNNMQVAGIAMEYFLGSKDRAAAFVDVMKDFAAVTPFTTEQALNMSQRLMAMGFAAQNVKSVLGILTDAASATGGTPEQMDRIVLALGQMKTNGYIAGQELRQLAEASIPVYTILEKKLGLTKDQLKNIGKLKISGDLGVAAVLQGLEEKYKGAAAKIANTIPGMWSTIKDDFLLISEQMFKGPYGALNGFLTKVRDSMEKARSIIKTSGIGGLFESMFPPQIQGSIRAIIGSIKSLAGTVVMLVKAVGPAFMEMTGVIITTFGIILPQVAGIARALATVATYALQVIPPLKYLIAAILGLLVAELAAKALMLLWRVTQLGAICTAVAKAVETLQIAIQGLYLVCTKNPIVGIVMLIAGALLYLALSSKTVSAWIDNVMGKLSSLAGINTDGILKPSDNAQKATDEFNKRLNDMQKNLTKVGATAKKAGKAVKDSFNASFDELYQVPEKLGETDDALEGLGEMADFKMPDMGDFKMPDLTVPDTGGSNWDLPPLIPGKKDGNKPKGDGTKEPPQIPPINPAPATKAIETIESAIERLKRKLQGAGEVVVAFFKDWVIKPIVIPGLDIAVKGLELVKDVAVGAANVFKNWVLKPIIIPGLDIAMAGLNLLKDVAVGAATLFNNWVIKPIVVPGIDLAESALKGLVNVAGTVKDFFTETLPNALKSFFTNMVPNFFSGLADFGKGALDAIVSGFWKVIDWISNNWKELLIGALIAVVAVVIFIFGGEIVAAIGGIGAAIGVAIDALCTAIAGFFTAGFGATVTGAIGVGFSAVLGAVTAALVVIGSVIYKFWDEIVAWLSGVWGGIVNIASTAWTAVANFFSGLWTGITNVATTAWNGIASFFTGLWPVITTALTTAWNAIALFFSTLWAGITTVATTAWNAVALFFSTLWTTITTALTTAWNAIATFFSGLWVAITTVFTAAWNANALFLSTLWTTITTVLTTAWNAIALFFSTLWTTITTALKTAWNAIATFFGTLWTTITTALKTAWNAISTFLSTLWTTITTNVKNAWNAIATFLTTLIGSIKTGFSNFSKYLSTLLLDLWNAISDTASGSWKAFTTMIQGLVNGITSVFSNMRDTIAGIFNGLWNTIKSGLNTVIGGVNAFINTVNGLRINIPVVNIPSIKIPGTDITVGGGSIGGGSVGFPHIPNIPQFATGSIVDRDGIYRLAEGGKREAVIPMENSTYMKPFSSAVANDLLEMLGGSVNVAGAGGGSNERIPVYVYNMIGDERGLKDLERKLEIIRINEDQRKGK